MNGPFLLIETRDLKGRAAAAAMILVAVLFAWFAIRWQLGNMFGALTPPNAPNAAEVARFAHDLSPHDPITNWLAGAVAKDDFSPEGRERAVAHFEEMARNAPYDYRSWIELGRALEQAEKSDRAERSFRRAVELAPAYSYPRWQLANFLLRQGRETDAIAEFRTVAATGTDYRDQVFSLIWDYFDKDPKRLEDLAGDRPEVLAGLAKFYAAKELAPESLRVWNRLSAEQKQEHQDVARVIAQALYEKKFFRSAVVFVKQLALEPQAQAETVQNGGFEIPLLEDAKKTYFNWKVVKAEKVEIRSDQLKKREGMRSLRINFNGYAATEIKNLWEVVAVEASTKYRLSFWVRTEGLKSAGTPLIEVVNANDNKLIATSPAFPTENNEWTELKVDFTAPSEAEGVLIRLDRAYCGDSCPIIGSVWLDDFVLVRQ